MPRATLTYKLPEEAADHRLALTGKDWALAAWDLDQQLRNWIKHGNHTFSTPDAALEGVRNCLHEALAGHGVDLEMLN